MTSLQHMGLHNIHIFFPVVCNLGQLLSSLPRCVTTLTLAEVELRGSNEGDRVLLFRAVALVRGLRELHVPQWEALVGGAAAACAQPLRALPHLHTIYVAEVKQSAAFPPGLNFQAISEVI